MALPVYPAGLKYKPDLNAFRVLDPYPRPTWKEFEDGPALGRRSMLTRRSRLAYRIAFFTAPELNTFLQFVENDLSDGTQRFRMPVYQPNTQGYAERTCQIDQGTVTSDPLGLGFWAAFTLIVYNWRTGP